MNPYDRIVELIIGFAFAITGGAMIIVAFPDYGTGLLVMFGVWFVIIGNRLFDKKKEETNDSQS